MSPPSTAEISSSIDPVRPYPTAARWIRRVGGPMVLVTGSVLVAVGMALHIPAMSEGEAIFRAISEDTQRWLASHLLQGFGFAIVAVGVATAVRLGHGRGATLTIGGAVLASLGAIVMSLGDIAHGAVSFALVDQVDMATSLEVHMAYFSHPAIVALNAGPMVITLGLLALGAGLLWSRAVPPWVGIVVLLSPVAVHLGFNLGLPTYLHGPPFVAGMTALAYALGSIPRSTAQQAGVSE